MKRGFVVAVGGAALVIAGLSGCSSDDKSSSATSETSAAATSAEETTSAAASESPTAATGSGTTKVTIDGQDQAVQGSVVCAAMGGNMNIAIGDAATGIAAVVSEDGKTVTSVGLGNVNGVTLGFTAGAGGEASGSVDGKTYTINGTATGVDMANPMTPVNKPFEIVVTCP
ncbi:lipoprotein LpqH [Mycolicibacterium bacteremicum]|uniref:lipoprotein LpqH n=1 Tax=Mycolicibacterium bacteremicum TaxID=564198 RepID=UPI0026EB7042|nr:lipoprotein LpqH [Mycolicibacterium bacteremicum]